MWDGHNSAITPRHMVVFLRGGGGMYFYKVRINTTALINKLVNTIRRVLQDRGVSCVVYTVPFNTVPLVAYSCLFARLIVRICGVRVLWIRHRAAVLLLERIRVVILWRRWLFFSRRPGCVVVGIRIRRPVLGRRHRGVVTETVRWRTQAGVLRRRLVRLLRCWPSVKMTHVVN